MNRLLVSAVFAVTLLGLIQGDSSVAVGKITHYGQGEIGLERTIKINNIEIAKESLKLQNSKIDSLKIKASDTDSISVLYSNRLNSATS